MIRAVQAVYFTVLGLWVGSLAVLGAVVAPTTFRAAPSRADAGRIFGAVLERFGVAELVLAGLVLGTAWLLRRGAVRGSRAGWIRVALALILALLCATSVLVVNPAVRNAAALRDNPAHHDRSPASFDLLHAWATRLMAARLVGGLLLLAYSGAALRSPDGS